MIRSKAGGSGLRALLAILILCSSLQARAEQFAFLFGGVEDGDAAKNPFAQDFLNLESRFSARGWHVESAFNKGAVRGAIESGLDHLVREAKTGDQVLIYYEGHGARRESGHSHPVIIADRDKDDGAYHLDNLQPALEALRRKGVRTAVVDLSCFSGATQNLEAWQTCRVSLASEKYTSVCASVEKGANFTAKFIDLPSEGAKITLEEQFLRSRRADRKSVNLPTISSIRNPLTDELATFLDLTDPDSYKRRGKLETRPFLDLWGTKPKPMSGTPLEEVCIAYERILDRMKAVIDSPAAITVRALLEAQRDEMKKELLKFEAVRKKLEKRFIEVELELRRHQRAKDPIRIVRMEEFEKKSEELSKAGAKLMAIEREFYDEYLRATRIMNEGVANPCRDFWL